MSTAKTILLLSDNPGEDYVSRVRMGLERTCKPSGLDVEAINVYGRGTKAADVLRGSEHAGIVLTPPLSDDRPLLSIIEARSVPMVRIAAILDPDRGNIVSMDEFAAASAIVGILTDRGHRRIAILRGPQSHLVSLRRYNGYANALGAKGLRVDQSLVAKGDFTRESGKREAPALFAAKPTAIFASNDEMAAGVVDAANDAGIAIPGDISLVGYDTTTLWPPRFARS